MRRTASFQRLITVRGPGRSASAGALRERFPLDAGKGVGGFGSFATRNRECRQV